jgi:hypothetical protein
VVLHPRCLFFLLKKKKKKKKRLTNANLRLELKRSASGDVVAATDGQGNAFGARIKWEKESTPADIVSSGAARWCLGVAENVKVVCLLTACVSIDRLLCSSAGVTTSSKNNLVLACRRKQRNYKRN